MKKILIGVTNHDQLGHTGKTTGYHLAEVSHPFLKFKAAHIEVDFVSPKGGKAPMDESSYHLDDPENKQFVETTEWISKLNHTLNPESVNPKEYAGIFFAGGHGTMWDFPDNAKLADLIREIYENGGIVGAVCHGPAALVNARLSNGEYLVSGKKMAVFTNAEEKAVGAEEIVPFLLQSALEERGAKIQEAPNWSENVVVDGHLVTGQNPKSADGVGEEMIKLIKA